MQKIILLVLMLVYPIVGVMSQITEPSPAIVQATPFPMANSFKDKISAVIENIDYNGVTIRTLCIQLERDADVSVDLGSPILGSIALHIKKDRITVHELLVLVAENYQLDLIEKEDRFVLEFKGVEVEKSVDLDNQHQKSGFSWGQDDIDELEKEKYKAQLTELERIAYRLRQYNEASRETIDYVEQYLEFVRLLREYTGFPISTTVPPINLNGIHEPSEAAYNRLLAYYEEQERIRKESLEELHRREQLNLQRDIASSLDEQNWEMRLQNRKLDEQNWEMRQQTIELQRQTRELEEGNSLKRLEINQRR